jgi:hypothetical protein
MNWRQLQLHHQTLALTTSVTLLLVRFAGVFCGQGHTFTPNLPFAQKKFPKSAVAPLGRCTLFAPYAGKDFWQMLIAFESFNCPLPATHTSPERNAFLSLVSVHSSG